GYRAAAEGFAALADTAEIGLTWSWIAITERQRGRRALELEAWAAALPALRVVAATDESRAYRRMAVNELALAAGMAGDTARNVALALELVALVRRESTAADLRVTLRNAAMALDRAGRRDEAVAMLSEVVDGAAAAPGEIAHLEALAKLVEWHTDAAAAEPALARAQQAWALLPEGDASDLAVLFAEQLGRFHAEAGRPDSAVQYQRALRAQYETRGEELGEFTATMQLLPTLVQLNLRREALETADRAVEMVQGTGELENILSLGELHTQLLTWAGATDRAIGAYADLADRAARAGRRETAVALLERQAELEVRALRNGAAMRTLERAESLLPADATEARANLLISRVGILAELGRPDSARRELARARALLGNAPGVDAELRLAAERTRVLQMLGDSSAYASALEALRLARLQGIPSNLAHTLSVAGHLALTHDGPEAGLQLLREALDVARAAGDEESEMFRLQQLGYALLRSRNDSLAHRAFASALTLAREQGDRYIERAALTEIAVAYSHDPATYDRRRALAYFDSAATLAAHSIQNADSDRDRILTAESGRFLWERWALAHLAHGRDSSEAAAYGALAAAERGRTQAMLTLMRQDAASEISLPDVGADLEAEGRALVSPILAEGAAVLAYQMAFDSLLIWFARPGAPLRLLRVAANRDSLAQSVAAWRASLGVDGASVLRSGAMEGLRGTVGVAARADAGAAARLAAWLLPPALHAELAEVRELVVIPSGVLHLVPFAALDVGAGGRPLGSTAALRYAPSLR
ncbi:MAG TPA: CHAT domain-containing protein, partial [Gemmatimonadaceae bacterium]|nr:CHAT domain-containing protein [Gemmatimonadaceae bacterium]